MNETVQFFHDNAGWSYDPRRESSEQGRQRCAYALAAAEAWAENMGMRFTWEDDWDVGSHREHYGADSAYSDGEPTTCETCIAWKPLPYDGWQDVASLGCIDDATDDYRRVIAAELAMEVRP